MRRGNVKDEVLVRFSSVTERDEVIGHAVNLKDLSFPAGVRLDVPGHLQSDFKTLVQYGNDAKNHFGGDIKRSVRFFEQEYGLVLNLCLPSGKWITVSPNEARAVIKHRRQMEERSFHHTLSSSGSGAPSFSESALEKAWLSAPSSPLSGANAVPLTSTPSRPEKRKKPSDDLGPEIVERPGEDDEEMESQDHDGKDTGGRGEKEKGKNESANQNL